MFKALFKLFRYANREVEARREGRETENWRTFKESPRKEDDGQWRHGADYNSDMKNWKI